MIARVLAIAVGIAAGTVVLSIGMIFVMLVISAALKSAGA